MFRSVPDLTDVTVFQTSLSRLFRFSFFSRDKQRGAQRGAHIDAGIGGGSGGFGSWMQKDDVYTEQAQEALQHL